MQLKVRNNRNILASSSFVESFFGIKAEFQDTSILNAKLAEYLHFIRTRKNGMRAVQTICYDRFLFVCFRGLLFPFSYSKPLLSNGALDRRYLSKLIWFNIFPRRGNISSNEKRSKTNKNTRYTLLFV